MKLEVIVVLACSDEGRVYFNIFLQKKFLSVILDVCLVQNSSVYIL